LNLSLENWSADEQLFLNHLLSEHESMRQVHELSGRFRKLMKEKSGKGLAKWCNEAEQVRACVGFVRGLRQDYSAVE
jgi:hypothetical protein